MALPRHDQTPAATVVQSIHAQGILLFNTTSGHIFSANASGARVWQHLAAGLPLGRITEQLSREYQADPKIVGDCVASFVAELARHGLVTGKA